MRRVVVTGMSGICPLGDNWLDVKAKLAARESGVIYMPEWDIYEGLNTRLGAPVNDFVMPKQYTRKQLRSMDRVAMLSVASAGVALEDAGLLDDERIKDGRMGVAYGSSAGGVEATKEFGTMLLKHTTDSINSTTYVRMMSHTMPVNIGIVFGLTGRIMCTSTACTSGSQGIGFAYEAIKYGQQELMVAGGAEQLSSTEAAVFDTLYATSVKNDAPTTTPAPFDRDRDGLVIGEGAGTFILEELEHAKARGAKIYAEVIGFGCTSDGSHVTRPKSETMGYAMELALKDANMDASPIGYVDAHGTATDQGDIAETQATQRVLGYKPISSQKSYMGHTLGACGSLEAWMAISMMNDKWFAPTINLNNVDERCGDLDYITGNGKDIDTEFVMSNNFAFGGVNTSLIFKRYL